MRNTSQIIPVFTVTGNRKHDLWLANGSADLGWISGRTLPNALEPLPIRLNVGNNAFGEKHIEKRHGGWVARYNMSVAELVWSKLQTSGTIYSADPDSRLNLSLRLAPESLMVIEWRQSYFSVVSLYSHPTRPVDGQVIGRYRPQKQRPVM